MFYLFILNFVNQYKHLSSCIRINVTNKNIYLECSFSEHPSRDINITAHMKIVFQFLNIINDFYAS